MLHRNSNDLCRCWFNFSLLHDRSDLYWCLKYMFLSVLHLSQQMNLVEQRQFVGR